MTKGNQYLRLSLISLLAIYFQIDVVKANKKSNGHFSRFQIIDSVKVKGSYRWLTPKQFTPLSFIKALTMNETKPQLIHETTVIDAFPDNWVKSSDLDSLITLIGSTTKCNCSLNPLSSRSPTNENADVGGYAIFFINSYRQKSKISIGLYTCPRTNKESVDEIMKWWTGLDPGKK